MSQANTTWKRSGFFSADPKAEKPGILFGQHWDDTSQAKILIGTWDKPSEVGYFDISLFAPAISVSKAPKTYNCLAAQYLFPDIGYFAPTLPGTIASHFGGVRAGTESFLFRSGIYILEVNLVYVTVIFDKDGTQLFPRKLNLDGTYSPNFDPPFELHGLHDLAGQAQNDGKTRPYPFLSKNSGGIKLDPKSSIIFEIGIQFNYLSSGYSYDAASAIVGFGDPFPADSAPENALYDFNKPNEPAPEVNCGFQFFGFTGSGDGWKVTEV